MTTLPQRLQNAGLSAGIWLQRATERECVLDLVKRLRPEPSSHELIRIGPKADGGYLVPDDLSNIRAAISPGVSTECGFDLSLARRGIQVLMLDASVCKPPVYHPLLHFKPLFLDAYRSEMSLTLNDAAAEYDGDLLLQMDIESAEYRVLAAASSETLQRFRVMVIEFHNLQSVFDRLGYITISTTFDKILRTHAIVHAHANNYAKVTGTCTVALPQIMEFTFQRRDRRTAGALKEWTYPHPLDCPNLPDRPETPLPACWGPSS